MPLPPGLALNPSTGQVSGIPTTAGSYSFDVQVRDSLGSSRTVASTIVVNAYTAVTASGGAPDGTSGTAYSYTYSHANGTAAYVWSVFSGALPTGVTLNTGTGQISGTPSVANTFTYTLRVTDGIGRTADVSDSVDIVGALTLTGTLAKPTVGVAYSSAFTRGGGQAPYVFQLTGTLPAGLSFNTSTGTISGTPTTTASQALTVQVADNLGNSASANQTLTVANPPSLSGTLPASVNGQAYSAGLTLSGGHTPFVWSILSGALPNGLAINTSTGLITGTCSAAGTFNFVVKVVDAAGNEATRAQTVVVAAAVVVGNAAPDGAVGVAVNHTYSVSGGTAPYTWSISAGSLPTGLSLNASTGKLSGTPSVAGNYSFTVKAADSTAAFGTFAETVNIATAVTLAGTLTNKATLTVAYSSNAVTASNGTTPYTYSIVSGTPPGLSINSSTGALTGTPTTTGSYSPVIRVTDARGSVANSTQAVTVAAFPTLSGTLPGGTQSVAYSAGLTGAQGHTPYAWAISVGTLPAGLAINASTGVISGTPTTPATSGFTVRLTDAAGNVVTSAQSVTIAATLALSGSYAAATQGTAYSSSVTRTGGTSPFTYSLSGGSLPPGLSLDAGTNQITGTPSSSGTYGFTLKVVDALGQQATSSQSLVVAAITHSVSASNISGSATSPADAAGSATATITGGIGPFVHSWAFIAGGSSIVLTNITTATVTATVSNNTAGSYTGTLRDTVTDTGNGNVTAVKDISVALTINPGYSVSAPDIFSSVVHPTDASGSSTATVSGGVGPFTHFWDFAPGGENADIVLTGTTTATVTATVTLNAFPEQYQATLRDTVTDTGNGNQTTVAYVSVFLEVT